MSEKIYIGKAKPAKFGMKLNICLSDIPTEHVTEFNGKKYFRADLNELRQPDDKGNTHTIILDTWKPQSKLPE